MEKNFNEFSDVIIVDGLSPEEGAMSQALYSRQPKSILQHLAKIKKSGAKSFMATWYSGYGHNSIGDCGSSTLHFENVSMLAAKAIQDWPLYNGQEASTRYLDFSGRMMINPLGVYPYTRYTHLSKELLDNLSFEQSNIIFSASHSRKGYAEGLGQVGADIQNRWMSFYETHLPLVQEYVAELNPKKIEQDEVQYAKAINARAFDIMRAFLPAGMTTLVSWHSNVRQFRDHLAVMQYHPSSEVSRIAQTATEALRATYPDSFTQKNRPASEEYFKLLAHTTSYVQFPKNELKEDFMVDGSNLKTRSSLFPYAEILANRPAKESLPNIFGELGTAKVVFKIDFGSFRDVQRHRKGVCAMPLLTTHYGFHPWYLERLPEKTRIAAEQLIGELEPTINNLPCTDVDRQYYIPMGYIVVPEFTWTLDQCVYVAELRSSQTVHQTLRTQAQRLGTWIESQVPKGTKLYVDYSEDSFSYARGKQDIVAK